MKDVIVELPKSLTETFHKPSLPTAPTFAIAGEHQKTLVLFLDLEEFAGIIPKLTQDIHAPGPADIQAHLCLRPAY
jgi:hypothetical protein